MIIADLKMIGLAVRYTGSIRGQTKCVTGIGFRHICCDTDIRVVDQTGQTFRDLPVRITLANIELEFIVHIVDRNIKRIGGRSKRGCQIRKKITQILLRHGRLFYFDIKFRRSSCGGIGAYVGSLHDIIVCGVGTLFPEQSIRLQSADLCDGVVQFAGVFLQIHGIILCVFIGGGKIPGSVLVQLYDRVVYTAKLTLFMGVIFCNLS